MSAESSDRTAPLTVASLAELTGGTVDDPRARGTSGELDGLRPLADAGASDLTFADHARRLAECGGRTFGALLLDRQTALPDDVDAVVVRVDDVEHAVADVLDHLAPAVPAPAAGVHPSAVVDPAADVDPSAAVGPLVTIEAGARVGAGVILRAGVHVASDAAVGDGTDIGAGAVIGARCSIGRGCRLHAGVVVGADGFNYRPRPDGRGLRKITHIGAVRIGDDVEIGANSCVDRGKFGDTILGDGTKIDNVCQIGHNCVFGRCVVIAAGGMVGGSVRIGDGVMIGGGTAVRDHVVIGAGAQVGGNSGVVHDVSPGARVTGFPADDAAAMLREWASSRRLRRR